MNQTQIPELKIRPSGYFSQNYSVANKGSTNGLELEGMTKLYFYGRLMVQPAIETINQMLDKLKIKFPKMKFLDDGDRRVRITIPYRRERIIIYYDMDNPTIATRIEGYVNSKYNNLHANSINSFVWISLKEYHQIKAKEHKAKFDAIVEDTQGLIDKRLLL